MRERGRAVERERRGRTRYAVAASCCRGLALRLVAAVLPEVEQLAEAVDGRQAWLVAEGLAWLVAEESV